MPLEGREPPACQPPTPASRLEDGGVPFPEGTQAQVGCGDFSTSPALTHKTLCVPWAPHCHLAMEFTFVSLLFFLDNCL